MRDPSLPPDPFRRPAGAPGAAVHVRVLDIGPHEQERLERRRQPLPEWYRAWVQPSYVRRHEPFAVDVPDVTAAIDGREVRLERYAVAFPHLAVVEIGIFAPHAPTDAMWSRDGFRVPPGVLPPAEEGDPSAPGSLYWLCDMTYGELTHRRVSVLDERVEDSGPYRSDGSVLFLDDALEGVPGLVPGEACRGRLAELAVHRVEVPRGLAEAGGYVVVGAAATRARHLAGRLHHDIDLAARALRTGSPWHRMHVAAGIQWQALAMRSELTGRAGFFFSRFELQRLYKAVSPTFGVPPDDLEALDRSIDDLQGYSATLLGLAIDHSQKLFGLYGLVFSLFSLGFASIAILDFVNATPSREKIWVGVALAAVLLAFASIAFLFSRRVRTGAASGARSAAAGRP